MSMKDIASILDFLTTAMGVLLAIGGLLGFIFRSWISEAIKHRFSKAVARELDTHRHELNRELESYKGSVIREIEHHKANLDLRRTIAIKMADARLDALRRLTSALDRYCNECLSWTKMNSALRQSNLAEFNQASESARAALRDSRIFLPTDLNLEVSRAIAAGANLAGRYPANSDHLALEDDPELKAIMKAFVLAELRLHEQIFALPPTLDERVAPND